MFLTLKNIIFKLISNIIILLILYVYLFRPEFKSSPGKISYLCSGIIVIANIILLNKTKVAIYLLRKEIILSLLILSFTIVRFFLGGEFFNVSIIANLIIDLFGGSFILAYFFKNNNILFSKLIIVSIFASLISLYSFIEPNFKDLLFSIFVFDEKLEIYSWRGFGLASDILFTFSITISIVLCYIIENKRYILLILFIVPFLIAILFNARIGIIPIVLYLLYKIIIEKKFKVILYILLFIFLLVTIIQQSGIYDEYSETFDWVLEAFADMSNSILGTSFDVEVSNMDVLENMVVLPNTISEWIFGKGYSLFMLNTGNSDIGYILQLNYGGIIYCILLLAFLILICTKFYILNKNNWLGVVLPICILLLNYKGDIFQASSFTRIFMLIYIISIFEYYNYTMSNHETN